MLSRQPSIEFKCPGCEDLIREIVEEVPRYDVMADRESDAQGFVEQPVNCPGCELESTVSITNTGAGLVAALTDGGARVTVIDDPIEQPDDEFEIEAYQRANLPSDPGQIFKFATYDIDYIASEIKNGPLDALNRMLFVQYFSALEAYLSDRLIRLVLDEPEVMSALVKHNKEWVAEKIAVTELALNQNAFRDWVHARLRELMYHNFVKIDMYYRGALGLTIFPDEKTKKVLMGYLPLRHDCVHRYGRDHNGRERTISKTDLSRLGSAAEDLVNHLEVLFAQRVAKQI